MRLSGSGFGFLWGVPVLSGLFTLVTVVLLARVGGRLVLILRVIITITREGT